MILQIVAILIILFLLVLNITYRLQIKNIYKQVDFLKKHQTNKRIIASVQFKEVDRLIESLNELIAIQNQTSRDYKIKDRALKETITNISHDIRTPLTSLNGYFQMLMESDSKEEKERYTEIIQTRIDNLKDLLEDMFTYIKIQDNNYKIIKEKIDLNSLVQENLLSYYEDFKIKEIEPKIDILEKPIILLTSPVALDRIINNLINNSLIHGESFITVRLLEEGDLVRLTFENDVLDISDIDLENIFDRFYKNDKARTVNSTGLGLTIVKELVESIDGKIEASLKENVFKVVIEWII